MSAYSAYDFELFYHSVPIEDRPEVPPDYVPNYAWLESAVEQIFARWEFNKRYTHQILSSASSLGSAKSNVTFVTFGSERKVYESALPVSVKMALIQSRRSMEEAGSQMRAEKLTWDEIAPYWLGVNEVMREFEREHKPIEKRKFFGFLKKSFGDSE